MSAQQVATAKLQAEMKQAINTMRQATASAKLRTQGGGNPRNLQDPKGSVALALKKSTGKGGKGCKGGTGKATGKGGRVDYGPLPAGHHRKHPVTNENLCFGYNLEGDACNHQPLACPKGLHICSRCCKEGQGQCQAHLCAVDRPVAANDL